MSNATCHFCKKELPQAYACDAIYFCSECQKERPHEIRMVYMREYQYWHDCNTGWNKSGCSDCKYSDICGIKGKQVRDHPQGPAGEGPLNPDWLRSIGVEPEGAAKT